MYIPNHFVVANSFVEGISVPHHSFAQFFSAFRGKLVYLASFSPDVLKGANVTILAKNRAGSIVAAETSFVGQSGKLICLPTISDNEPVDYDKAGAVLKQCINGN